MTNPAVQSLLARLARLRRRIRRWLVVGGLGHVLLWAAGLAAGSFFADLLLDLPLGVRRFVRFGLLDRPDGLGAAAWLGGLVLAGLLLVGAARRRSRLGAGFAFALGGGAGVLVWAVGRHLVAPLRIPLPDADLALAVERGLPPLRDRLSAALDFDRELAAPSRGESAALMAGVIDDAARDAHGLEFSAIVTPRRPLAAAGLGALAAAAVAAVLLAMLPSSSLWARRSLLLEDLRWPQETTVVAVVRGAEGSESEKDPASPYVAALGQSLTVHARARGRVPGKVEIVDRVLGPEGAGRPLARAMRPVPGEPGLFEHEFRDVRGAFSFTLRGGDDADEEPAWRVEVRVPPRLTTLRCDLAFPAYLGLPARRVEGGDATVPEGTRVLVTFAADAPVERAEAFVDEAPSPVERDGDQFRLVLQADKTLRYRLRVVTTDGREVDPATTAHEVTVEPDTPPRSEWVWPRAAVETTVRGRVPLFARTRDDHGIASMALEVLVAGAPSPVRIPLEPRTPQRPDGPNDAPWGAQEVWTYLPVEAASLRGAGDKPLVPPTRFQARVVATDGKGQEAAGPWSSTDLLRPDELERGLAGQRARAKQDLEAARAEARGLRDLTAGLAAAGQAGDAERQALRDVQFRQGKLRGDADRAARAVGGLFATYLYARLGADVPTETLLALLDRRHRASFAAPPPAPEGAPTPSAEGADDPFAFETLRLVVAARRDRTVFDTGVLDKTIAVLERVVEAADPLAVAAAEAAAVAARSAQPADLAALVSAQTRLVEGLTSALAAMAEWQSLSELTLFLRRVIEEQEALNRDVRDLRKDPR